MKHFLEVCNELAILLIDFEKIIILVQMAFSKEHTENVVDDRLEFVASNPLSSQGCFHELFALLVSHNHAVLGIAEPFEVVLHIRPASEEFGVDYRVEKVFQVLRHSVHPVSYMKKQVVSLLHGI